jgi:hypothetical protein
MIASVRREQRSLDDDIDQMEDDRADRDRVLHNLHHLDTATLLARSIALLEDSEDEGDESDAFPYSPEHVASSSVFGDGDDVGDWEMY